MIFDASPLSEAERRRLLEQYWELLNDPDPRIRQLAIGIAEVFADTAHDPDGKVDKNLIAKLIAFFKRVERFLMEQVAPRN